MRNSLIGIGFAAILVAALFAAAHYGSRPSAQQPGADQPTDPAKIVAALPQDFIGDKMVGNWRVSCSKQRSLPRAPQSGNSDGATPKQAPPPPGWKLPHCNVSQALRNPKDPNDEVRVTFRRMGFQSVLAIFLRFPPDAVETGDPSTLKLDTANIPMPVRTCAARFCLSIMSIKHADEPAFLKTKTMSLTFTSRASGKEIVAPFKMHGFEQAVGAMRRMDK